jgi:AcrR family transcriptional regulator
MEKKQRIIQASYDLFCHQGYYKTNTAEIAQQAGVSTGIVYSYFHDKKDILIEVIRLYISSLSSPLQPLLFEPVDMNHLPVFVGQLFDVFFSSHSMSIEAHNEFMALSLLEDDLLPLFVDFENALLKKLSVLLVAAGIPEIDLLEKLKISYGIVEHVCHDSITKKWAQDEFSRMKALAVQTILHLLNEVEINIMRDDH